MRGFWAIPESSRRSRPRRSSPLSSAHAKSDPIFQHRIYNGPNAVCFEHVQHFISTHHFRTLFVTPIALLLSLLCYPRRTQIYAGYTPAFPLPLDDIVPTLPPAECSLRRRVLQCVVPQLERRVDDVRGERPVSEGQGGVVWPVSFQAAASNIYSETSSNNNLRSW